MPAHSSATKHVKEAAKHDGRGAEFEFKSLLILLLYFILTKLLVYAAFLLFCNLEFYILKIQIFELF